MTNEELTSLFEYHTPVGDQQRRIDSIRRAAIFFATTINENTQPSADQSAAFRKIREAMMTANAAMMLEGQ